MQSPPSVCFHSIFGTNWPLTFNFGMWVGHDHSSQGIEGHGHGSGLCGRSDLDRVQFFIVYLRISHSGVGAVPSGLPNFTVIVSIAVEHLVFKFKNSGHPVSRFQECNFLKAVMVKSSNLHRHIKLHWGRSIRWLWRLQMSAVLDLWKYEIFVVHSLAVSVHAICVDLCRPNLSDEVLAWLSVWSEV